MLPATEHPTPPRIIWSGSAQRFINTDTGKFVSNLEGVQTLRAGRPFGQPGFVDMAGHAAPSPINLTYPGYTNEFLNSTRKLTPVFEQAYEQVPPPSSYYVTLAFYTDENGVVKVTQVFNKVGEVVDFENEERRIAATIARELNVPQDAMGTKLLVQKATQLIHYIAK